MKGTGDGRGVQMARESLHHTGSGAGRSQGQRLFAKSEQRSALEHVASESRIADGLSAESQLEFYGYGKDEMV